MTFCGGFSKGIGHRADDKLAVGKVDKKDEARESLVEALKTVGG